jgi:transposase
MSKRHALTDKQWQAVEPLLPRSTARTGHPPSPRRLMLDGIFWVLATGAPWRDLPERFGPWQTVYEYFSNWRRSGVFAAIVEVTADKECRRIGTRFEKLAVNFHGMLQLAMIRRYVKLLFSDTV